MRFSFFVSLTAVLWLPASLWSAEPAPDFSREVRPILSRYCFKCHGPDDKARKSELRLDVREAALKPAESGEHAIVPGKPDASELVKRIFTDDADDAMPPRSTKQDLSAAQKDILRRWIAAGAEYRQHWAFVAPKRPAVPGMAEFTARLAELRSSDAARAAELAKQLPALAGWPRNALDSYLLERQLAAGLAPSPEADAGTICRRLYLDLIGLPPTLEQLSAFEKAAAGGLAAAVGRLADE